MQKHEDGSIRICQSYVWSKNGESFFVSTCKPCEGLNSLQTIVCRYDHSTHECGEPLFVGDEVDLFEHAAVCQWIAASDNPEEFVRKSLAQTAEVRSILRGGGA